LKLDTAVESTFRFINRPAGHFTLEKLLQNLKLFRGNFILQTLFLRGSVKGKVIDNATKEELGAWLRVLEEIKPAKIMVYTFARDTPVEGLQKIPADELREIALQAEELGFDVEITA
ncbi:MAG TPA: radical SAM protein, partial [Bacteroidales bacterium]|nr:radical SAM protein [Bacteroidales bacterium]